MIRRVAPVDTTVVNGDIADFKFFAEKNVIDWFGFLLAFKTVIGVSDFIAVHAIVDIGQMNVRIVMQILG